MKMNAYIDTVDIILLTSLFFKFVDLRFVGNVSYF